MQGYVYILEVKDIILPVCKIGMTERDPARRCAEINNGSTGDFLWEVADYVYVNDCQRLESLVHAKLAPLRQKRREFFNLGPADAYTALVSILEQAEDIRIVEQEVGGEASGLSHEKWGRSGRRSFGPDDGTYAELLYQFADILQVKGQPFGQLNRPYFGISDGNTGLQWNLKCFTAGPQAQLGVNLEGSQKTGRWLIADFLLSDPDIESLVRQIHDPTSIEVSLYRDAWQGPSRLEIQEKHIGGRSYLLSDLRQGIWAPMIQESLSCLDESRGYRGRRKAATVTLSSDGRTLVRDVSPHLTISKSLDPLGNAGPQLREAISALTPAYEWVSDAIGTPR